MPSWATKIWVRRMTSSGEDPVASVHADSGDRDLFASTEILVGRDPGGSGLVVGAEDQSVSARALTAYYAAGEVRIRNSSTYAPIEITSMGGLRLLFPGESISVDAEVVARIPGRTQSHPIRISPTLRTGSKQPKTGTQPLLEGEPTIAEERHRVLTALCLPKFFPERFGSALLNARQISQVLEPLGVRVSPKAVNNKLQRLREQVAERHGVYLDTREDLAEYAIRQGLVTLTDARQLMGKG